MNKLIIYQSTLIYAALYFKRLAQPEGKITLTEEEFTNYFDLVINDIEEEKSIANAFEYEIIYDGEPIYKLNLANKETLDLLNSATYKHDKEKGVFSTSSIQGALSLKSKVAYPSSLSMTLRPKGYEQALNIVKEKKSPSTIEPTV